MLYQILKPAQTELVDSVSYARSLAKDLESLNQGLYVLFFENNLANNILDPKPKIVVNKFGASIKPGKFEKTFSTRLSDYERHMRFEPAEENVKSAFKASFLGAFVLDLSNSGIYSSAKIFEQYWIQEINIFLEVEKILRSSQNNRAEWKNIEANMITHKFLERFHAHLSEVAKKISMMQKII